MVKKIAGWAAFGVVAVLVGRSIVLAQITERRERRAVVMNDDGGQTFFLSDDGRAWMGVELKDVTSDEAKAMKLPGDYGAIVASVEKDSPAAKAGIEKNDVIIQFAGERVWSVSQLRRAVGDTPPGRAVEVEVSRDGQTRTVSVTLEGHERSFGAMTPPMPPVEIPEVKIPDMHFYFGMGAPRLGISAAELTPQLAGYFGVKEGKGVLIREVTAGSAAEKAGLKAGDCIVRLNSTAVDSVESLQRALGDLFKGSKESEKRQATLTFVRDRREQTVNVEIASPRERWPGFSEEAQSAAMSAGEYARTARELQNEAMAQARAVQQQSKELQKMRADILKQTQSLRNDAEQRRALQELEQQLRVGGII
ncbi:MAG TPA: PDZ domain-containing protein [Terriglobia bacterium]|nr:PDZ domain-containing protein [Terriglobia bacterium]